MKKIPTAMLAAVALGLAGCEEIPKQPVMRPIPPPPPTPPPGISYVPPAGVSTNSGAPGALASPNTLPGYEVTSNFVGSAQVLQSSQPPTQSAQPPQYEVVPPKPGPDYIWHDGFWNWNNGWSWVPGQWVYQPPSVIIVPGPGYYYGPRYYYGHGRRYYHRW